jgi:hypothetical protein
MLRDGVADSRTADIGAKEITDRTGNTDTKKSIGAIPIRAIRVIRG